MVLTSSQHFYGLVSLIEDIAVSQDQNRDYTLFTIKIKKVISGSKKHSHICWTLNITITPTGNLGIFTHHFFTWL